MITPLDIRGHEIVPGWQSVFSQPVSVLKVHFDAALDNIVRNPGVNSTILLRADIYFEFSELQGLHTHQVTPDCDLDPSWLRTNLADTKPRVLEIAGFEPESWLVRRNVPRNPHRDRIINQTCVFYRGPGDSRLVIYVPHCEQHEIPFYLPEAQAVGILFQPHTVSVHYLLYPNSVPLIERSPDERLLRIALNLLNTAVKHSKGVQNGYKKRVEHDVVVGRKTFQDTYICLKQKYAAELVANWAEKTDPRKHVFEDLGIAAFLIELWKQLYKSPSDFEFLDLGCGNGLLTHILIQEGYHGRGVDARERKSWATYPPQTQSCLRAQLIVPAAAGLSNDEDFFYLGKTSPDDQSKLFLIGNHSDELTLWLPLFGLPFMVIPCCSHGLSGQKMRFTGKGQKSTYQALTEKVMQITKQAGWKPELELLRIPSTRNAAIIGRTLAHPGVDLTQIIEREGGAEQWIEFTKKLATSKRSH